MFKSIGMSASRYFVVCAVGMLVYRAPENSEQLYQLMTKENKGMENLRNEMQGLM